MAFTALAQGNPALDARMQEIMHRPEFQNAKWGMKFYSPDTKQVIYSINTDQFFSPASAAKVRSRSIAATILDGRSLELKSPRISDGP